MSSRYVPPLRVLVSVMFLISCGGSSSPRTTPDTELDVDSHPETSKPAKPQHKPDKSVKRMKEEDCQRLFDHLFQLSKDAELAGLDNEQTPTPAEIASTAEELRPEFFEECVGAPQSDFHFECAMAATSPEELEACVGAKATP